MKQCATQPNNKDFFFIVSQTYRPLQENVKMPLDGINIRFEEIRTVKNYSPKWTWLATDTEVYVCSSIH